MKHHVSHYLFKNPTCLNPVYLTELEDHVKPSRQEIYDAIKNNTLPDVSLEDGLMSVAIGQAAELSIKENRVIKMSEFNL